MKKGLHNGLPAGVPTRLVRIGHRPWGTVLLEQLGDAGVVFAFGTASYLYGTEGLPSSTYEDRWVVFPSVAELGFPDGADFKAVCECALEQFGLQLGPRDLGYYLVLEAGGKCENAFVPSGPGDSTGLIFVYENTIGKMDIRGRLEPDERLAFLRPKSP